ncbi:MAG TPA: universal stress protein [Polyangiaceae bacterium]|jgi:nucleotide-binding universal stress UspA family protein
MNDKAPVRHILVAHDFSDTAECALDFALGLAEKLGARVTIVHAYEIEMYGYGESMVLTQSLLDDVARASRKALEGLVARARARATGVDVSYELRMGSPRTEIVDFAAEAKVDLIVIGTHGRRGVPRALLGSVAESVVRSAPCPVLTVHGPPSRK